MVSKVFLLVFSVIRLNTIAWCQQSLILKDFNIPHEAWFEAGNAALNTNDDKKLSGSTGSGVLINEHGKSTNLVTKQKHGDVKVELEFMMSKNSNSGVYLQGRYEIQILDSWGKQNAGSGDCGGIYARYDGKKTYGGIAPLVNAAKKPGEWQELSIDFKAPRFNSKGEKIKNAVFKKVKLNGAIVQKNVDLTGPTASSLDNREEPLGPLMLQGDHGSVAYRGIKIKNR